MTDQTTPPAPAQPAAAEAAPADTGQPTAGMAFALGWQVSELFRADLRHRSEPRDGDLPDLGSLSDDQRRQISVDQVQAALSQLEPAIQRAGLSSPAGELTTVRTALKNWDTDGQPAVGTLHVKLLGTLTAVDFRLGKAYGLGRALADTCRKPTDAAGVRHELEPYRVAKMLAWLDELSTALPPHAAHCVYTSLTQWRDWAGTEQPDDATLMRQGELWRTLLSGEKRGTEMLEIRNYLHATSKVAARMSSIVGRVLLHFWWLVLIVVALIAGAVVLFIEGGGSHVVAGAGALVAGLGLGWKGVGGALGKLAGRLEQPLWGAVLDVAIADAITLTPSNEADELGRAAVASDLAAGAKRSVS
jgi:hypothetical protein